MILVDLLVLQVGVVLTLATLKRVRGNGALLVKRTRVLSATWKEGWGELVIGELLVLRSGVLADVLLDHFAGVRLVPPLEKDATVFFHNDKAIHQQAFLC